MLHVREITSDIFHLYFKMASALYSLLFIEDGGFYAIVAIKPRDSSGD